MTTQWKNWMGARAVASRLAATEAEQRLRMTDVTAQLFNYSVSNHHVRMAATTKARRQEQSD